MEQFQKIAISLRASLKYIFFIFMLANIPVQSSAADDIYIKKFNPERSLITEPQEFQCNQRKDLVLIHMFGDVIPEDSEHYIKQYDPIISTSVLCRYDFEGMSKPKYEYINNIEDPPGEPRNLNGEPLQVYNVKAYCQLEDDIRIISPAEVILLCNDPSKKKKK